MVGGRQARVQDVQLSISEFLSTLAILKLILVNRFPETNETGWMCDLAFHSAQGYVGYP